jgi:hypothetical protein
MVSLPIFKYLNLQIILWLIYVQKVWGLSDIMNLRSNTSLKWAFSFQLRIAYTLRLRAKRLYMRRELPIDLATWPFSSLRHIVHYMVHMYQLRPLYGADNKLEGFNANLFDLVADAEGAAFVFCASDGALFQSLGECVLTYIKSPGACVCTSTL